MNAPRAVDARWHLVMAGLLYPAILGAIIFELARHASHRLDASGPFDLASLVPAFGGLALVCLFTFDFAHTASEDVKPTYGGVEFVFDLVLVVLMFLAGMDLLGDPVVATPFWALLAAAKLVGFGWEYKRDSGAAPQKAATRLPRNVRADLAFAGVYGLCGLVGYFQWPWIIEWLPLVMIVDAVVYIPLQSA